MRVFTTLVFVLAVLVFVPSSAVAAALPVPVGDSIIVTPDNACTIIVYYQDGTHLDIQGVAKGVVTPSGNINSHCKGKVVATSTWTPARAYRLDSDDFPTSECRFYDHGVSIYDVWTTHWSLEVTPGKQAMYQCHFKP